MVWEEVEAHSHVLILCSTVGYFTACLILVIKREGLLITQRFPEHSRTLLWLLSTINALAAVGTLSATQPNVGTLTIPLGFLPYAGIATSIAAPLGVLNVSRTVERRLAAATFLIVGAFLLAGTVWIVLAWLPALLAYYQPYLFIIVCVAGLSTVWLGFRTKKQTLSGQGLGVTKIVFFTLLAGEATAVFFAANVFLLIFLGLVLNA